METSSASSVTVQTPLSPTPQAPEIIHHLHYRWNCSDTFVKSHPDDLVSELGYGILVLYGYAFLVVAVTFGFFCKWE